MHDEETGAQIRALVAKGAIGGGVWETDDCKATHDELSAKGVQFLQEPAERPYGIEAVFRDDSGELVQPHAADGGLTSGPTSWGSLSETTKYRGISANVA
jgi:hypothetical protein